MMTMRRIKPPLMKMPDASNMTARLPSRVTRQTVYRPGTTGTPDLSDRPSTFDGRKDSPEGNVMDKDLDQAKGRVKQAAGDLTDNEKLKKEGKLDETAGKAKELLEDAKDKGDDLIDSMRNRERND